MERTSNMHSKDEMIIDALKKNARASCKEISRDTGIPITTVHNRIKKLEANNTIIGYRAMINQPKLGYKICAYVLIGIDYHPKGKQVKQDELAKELSEFRGVEETQIVTGDTDMVFKIRAKDMKDLNRIIKSIVETPGINSTNTLIVLEHIKDLQ